MPTKKKLLIATSIAALLILLVLLSLLLRAFLLHDYNEQKKADLELLQSSEYNSIFCSMYSVENFAQEDFVTYRGFNTLKLSNILRNTSDLGEYLSTAFVSGNTVENIYLGLDPAQMWSSSHENTNKWNAALSEDILAYATAHPEVTFEVLLPAPSLDYWLAKSRQETEEILTAYQSLIDTLHPYNNVIVYFLGNERWLIANPDNYSDTMTTNDMISRKILLFTFCDHVYQINTENASAKLNSLKELILQEQTAPAEYPDLSAWDVVFFGDSIIGNYTGSYSIPGVVSALTSAKTYNCAKGGIPACNISGNLSFPASADSFIAQDASLLPADSVFQTSLREYVQDDHSDRKLCFVINFGLNDYFIGCPVANAEDPYDETTYAGALRSGISKLQNAYPDATILVMTPTFTTEFSNGTAVTSEEGSVLTEYVDTALQVADEMKVLSLNNYTDLGINENTVWSYLEDGTHLNETGRFLLAEKIIALIGD